MINQYHSKKFIFILSTVIIVVFFSKKILILCNVNDGFVVSNIYSKLPFNSQWESQLTHEDKKNLRNISQKFNYLSKGAQCYTFVDEYNQYVIKFFKHQHLSTSSWLNHIPMPKRLKNYHIAHKNKRKQRLNSLFASHKIAYEKLKEETGLVFIHLNKSNDLNKKITIIDKLAHEHTIDLDKTEFVIQKKAIMIYPSIVKYMTEGQHEQAKDIIAQSVKLIKNRFKKGIVDRDLAFGQNYGVVNGNVIEIDIGKLNYVQTQNFSLKNELETATEELKQWLNIKYPSLSAFLDFQISSHLY